MPLLFVTFLFGLLWVYGGPSSTDDAWIYLRYVRNLLGGYGWVYNLGERVDATTSPLWTVLLLVPCKLLGPSLNSALLVDGVLVFLQLLLAYRIFRVLGHGEWAACALTALAIYEPHDIRHNFTGMETPLVTFSIIWVAYLMLTGSPLQRAGPSQGPEEIIATSPAVLGVSLGLLPAVRPELSVLALGGVGWVVGHACLVARRVDGSGWHRRHRNIAILIGAFGVTLGLHLGLAFWYFGNLIPQTALAKRFTLHQSLGYSITQTSGILVSSCIGAIVLFTLVAWAAAKHPEEFCNGHARWVTESPVMGLLVVLLCQSSITFLVLATSGALVSTRYACVLSYPCHLAFVLLAAAMFQQRGPRLRRLASFGVSAQLLVGAFVLWYVFPGTRVCEGGPKSGQRLLAEYVRDHTPRSARIATTEIGVIGFFSDRYIVDPLCLIHKDGLAFQEGQGKVSLEPFLKFKGATYYVESTGLELPSEGQYFRSQEIVSFSVTRNNLLHDRVPLKLPYTLYKLEPKPPSPAESE